MTQKSNNMDNFFREILKATIESRFGCKLAEGYDGIWLMKITDTENLAIDPETAYKKSLDGLSLEDYLNGIDISISFMRDKDVRNYQLARRHLMLKLVNKEMTKSWTDSLPHKDLLDLRVIFIYVIRTVGDELISANVSDDMLNVWNVDVDQVYTDAIRASIINRPAEVKSMTEVLGLEPDEADQYLQVATNDLRHYGAGVILYPEVMKKFYDKFGSFSVIPSSVHEVLFVSDKLGMSDNELAEMCQDVNYNVVKNDEILSSNIYRYDPETDSLNTAVEQEILPA